MFDEVVNAALSGPEFAEVASIATAQQFQVVAVMRLASLALRKWNMVLHAKRIQFRVVPLQNCPGGLA